MKKESWTVLIIGDLRKVNFGDAMIADALICIYKRAGANRVRCLSTRPKSGALRNDLEITDVFGLVRYLFACDEVCIGGGGLFQDDTGRWNLLYFLFWAFVARAFFCKLVVRSVSMTELRFRTSRLAVRMISILAMQCTMRDSSSRTYLSELAGVNAAWEEDAVFTWLSSGLVELQTCPSATATPAGPFLLVYLRPPPRHSSNAIDCDRLIVELRSVAKELGLEIRFGYFDKSKDVHFSEECLKRAGLGSGFLVHDREPEEAIRRIREAKVVVSLRLHPAIVANAVGVPFVAVSYNDKVRNYFETKGQDAFVVGGQELKEIADRVRAAIGGC